MRNIYKYLLTLPLLTSFLASCGFNPTLKNAKLKKDEKFNNVIIDMPLDSFNHIGFNLGDSCNVVFSNGYKLDDVPYYNGYYVKTGMPVIVAYPANEYVNISLNNVGLWDNANLSEEDTVSIYLNERGKYKATQEALGQSYSLLRKDYSSDEEFANFRSLKGGNLKDNILFRGASPVDNSRNRAKYVDNLLKENNIKSIVDLADNKDNMDTYLSESDFNSPYTKKIYEDGNMILLDMSSSYSTLAYKQAVANGFKHILNSDGPYYIHCMEGKDRTGFVCMLIEALFDASYEEMCKDYMQTYKNYFKVSKEETPQKYDAIVALYFDSFMEYLSNQADKETLKELNYATYAKNYLLEGGMQNDEINQLIAKLSK